MVSNDLVKVCMCRSKKVGYLDLSECEEGKRQCQTGAW
jgi:hypothetical protein